MTDIVTEPPVSPTQVGNFIIAYEQDVEFIEEDIDPVKLKKFIHSDNTTDIFSTEETSYFPRAFTDIDLSDLNDCTVTNVNTRSELKDTDTTCGKTKDISKMDGHSGDRTKFPQNFQPDVIVSNSNHRSGPDGSPALLPSGSKSQGFVPSTLSETGELFAPMKTLTFSDVDQNSHIEDISYMDTSRHVSTPNKNTVSQNQYNYSMANMPNFGHKESDSDSDSDHIHIDSRDKVPEFRQLEVDPDLDLLSTGAFHPSAHGLNKEFMDNFTGRTGNAFTSGAVFSPLSGYGNQSQQRLETHTPPLHKPQPNSPYSKQASLISQAQKSCDTEEIQFAMSPTRDSNGFKMQREQITSVTISQGEHMLINRQDFINSDNYYEYSYPNEHSFQPIDKHPHNFMSQKSVPKNLNEYSEKSPRNIEQKGKPMVTKPGQVQMENFIDRQGDGYDNELEENNINFQGMTPDSIDQQFAVVSPSAFEQRYLQKTQVSVMVPQATYDTMISNTSMEERMDPRDQDHSRFQQSYLPPDSFKHGENLDKPESMSGPGQEVDLLKSQSDHRHESQQHLQHETQQDSSTEHVSPKDDIPVTGDRKLTKTEQNVSNNSNHNTESETCVSNGDSTSKVQINQKSDSSQSRTHSEKQTAAQITKSSQQPSQIPQPSSRLLQETISKKSKVNQKFVSNNPTMSKSVPGPSKDHNKVQDPVRKGSNTSVTAGARKTIMNESEKHSVFKSKSMSMETLTQKQRSNQNPGRHAHETDQNNPSNNSHSANLLKRDSSHRGNHGNKGHGKGQGHNHSIEGSAEDSHVITQVQTVSPVPVEQNCPVVKVG